VYISDEEDIVLGIPSTSQRMNQRLGDLQHLTFGGPTVSAK
jgi:hypothetical protein